MTDKIFNDPLVRAIADFLWQRDGKPSTDRTTRERFESAGRIIAIATHKNPHSDSEQVSTQGEYVTSFSFPRNVRSEPDEKLIERLEKRARQDRSWAENNTAVAEALQEQMNLFEDRSGQHNTYAVRMAVDHRSNAKRDNANADDLEAAVALIKKLKAERDHAQPSKATPGAFLNAVMGLKEARQ